MRKTRNQRLNIIRMILEKGDVNTQAELKLKLEKTGVKASQATVSRDLKELGYSRIPISDGSYRLMKIQERDEHIDLFFRLGLEDLIRVRNFVVIKTRPGNAQAIAGAIDRTCVEGILGTVAGDDTIFAITNDESAASQVVNNLRKYLE